MRHIWRSIFAGLKLISLLLLLATLLLWVRSYWRGDLIERENLWFTGDGAVSSRVEVGVAFGGLGVLRWDQVYSNDDIEKKQVTLPSADGSYTYRSLEVDGYLSVADTGIGREASFMGFKFGRKDLTPEVTGRKSPLWGGVGVVVPLWALALVFAVLPMRTARRMIRARRRQPGSCPRCSYNLAGNVSGVCPECGTAIPKKVA